MQGSSSSSDGSLSSKAWFLSKGHMTLDAVMAGNTGLKRLVHQQAGVPPIHVPGVRRGVVAETGLRGDGATRIVGNF